MDTLLFCTPSTTRPVGYLRHKKHTLKETAFAVFFLSLPHTLLQKHMLL